MDVLPPDPAHARAPIAVDPMPDAADPAELLYIQVHQRPGSAALVADHGAPRLQPPEPSQSHPPLDVHHRGDRRSQRPGNPQRAPAAFAQALNPPSLPARPGPRRAVRPARAIAQPRLAFRPIPSPPPVHRGQAELQPLGDVPHRFPDLQPPHHQPSPGRRQAC